MISRLITLTVLQWPDRRRSLILKAYLPVGFCFSCRERCRGHCGSKEHRPLTGSSLLKSDKRRGGGPDLRRNFSRAGLTYAVTEAFEHVLVQKSAVSTGHRCTPPRPDLCLAKYRCPSAWGSRSIGSPRHRRLSHIRGESVLPGGPPTPYSRRYCRDFPPHKGWDRMRLGHWGMRSCRMPRGWVLDTDPHHCLCLRQDSCPQPALDQ